MLKKIFFTSITALIASGICSCSAGNGAFASTAEEKKDVVTVTYNGESESVPYEEYRFFFMKNKAELYGADAVLDDKMTAELRAMTEENIKQHYTVEFAFDKHDAELTKEDKANINDYTDYFRKQNGLTDDDAYKLYLEQNYITDRFLTDYYEYGLKTDSLLEKLIEDGTVPSYDTIINEAFKTDKIICIKEIFINHTGGETVEVARAEAERILGLLKDGANFEELMETESEYDPAQCPPEHGYYTAEYDALDEIWSAATAIAEGDHTVVIEAADGFHIIKRCAKDQDYMAEHKKEIADMYRIAEGNRYLFGLMSEVELSYTSHGESIDYSEIK